jgi:hypothetical protein
MTLVYSFVLVQTTYDQCNADLRDVHDWICVIDGNENSEELLKIAIRKLIIESPNHVFEFLRALKKLQLKPKFEKLRDDIYNDYVTVLHNNDNDDDSMYETLAVKHIEDLISIYYDFAKTDNYQYFKYTCTLV